jgi:hypothetical protein
VQERELRKTVGDTVYSLEQVNSLWLVKANGQPLGYPGQYATAREGYRALTQASK